MLSLDHFQFEGLVQRFGVTDPAEFITQFDAKNDLDRKLLKYSSLWQREPLAFAFAASLNAASNGDYAIAVLILAYYYVLQSVNYDSAQAMAILQKEDWLDFFYLSPQMLLICHCSTRSNISTSLRILIDAVLDANMTCAINSRATRQVTST